MSILVQVANSIIRNPKMNPIDFVLYARLKFLSFTLGGEYHLLIDPTKLRLNIGILDSRTLKKSFDNLKRLGYIVNNVEFRRKQEITVTLNEEYVKETPFTQLPITLLSQIVDVGHTGFRLLYYYESYINRRQISNDYCFTSLLTISEQTGIAKNTVLQTNEQLVVQKLLRIKKHTLKTEYNYDENDELIYNRYNNHYHVNLEKLI